MDRKEKMLVLLRLNDKMQEFIVKKFNATPTMHPELTASWLDKKFDRFYLVESTSNDEEEFRVHVELRYKLRSQEALKYGEGNQVFYDRYLSTGSVEIKYLDRPEDYIRKIEEEMNA